MEYYLQLKFSHYIYIYIRAVVGMFYYVCNIYFYHMWLLCDKRNVPCQEICCQQIVNRLQFFCVVLHKLHNRQTTCCAKSSKIKNKLHFYKTVILFTHLFAQSTGSGFLTLKRSCRNLFDRHHHVDCCELMHYSWDTFG